MMSLDSDFFQCSLLTTYEVKYPTKFKIGKCVGSFDKNSRNAVNECIFAT